MKGLVLCGGQSQRMGSDKGLLQTNGQQWADLALQKLTELELSVLLSINKSQRDAYSRLFDDEIVVIDNEALAIRGPLLGLLSVHLQYPDDDLFVLACDLPDMHPSLLLKLRENYQQFPDQEVFVYSNDGEPEPLCGIYTATALSDVMEMYRQDQLSRFSMKFILDHLDVLMLPIPEDQKKFFKNFNAHADLNGE